MAHEQVGFTLFAVLAVIPSVPIILLAGRLIRRRRASFKIIACSLISVLVYAAVCIDAFIIEPNWPELSTIEIKADIERPLVILHLSDLHLEPTLAKRDHWLAARLAELKPDMVALTGDIHQLDSLDQEPLRRMLGNVKPPLGTFACIGYDNGAVLAKALPDVRVLQNQGLVIQNGPDQIGLCGLLQINGRNTAYEAIADAPFRIVINHTPDLADEAATKDADLYLCGHTHGGQVRIPFWGAIITNSDSGKKYEAGLYQTGKTRIYTSRGFGLEPKPAPQVRFFCRPQITVIQILPASSP
jgi:predicted MPP superfamily phosphohydrolase